MGESLWDCLCERWCFFNDDRTVGAQVGFRYPAHLTGKDKNGYYVGAYAWSYR